MFPGVRRVHLLWSLCEGFWDPPGVFSLSRISCTPNPWASTWPLGGGRVGDTFPQQLCPPWKGQASAPGASPRPRPPSPALHVLAPRRRAALPPQPAACFPKYHGEMFGWPFSDTFIPFVHILHLTSYSLAVNSIIQKRQRITLYFTVLLIWRYQWQFQESCCLIHSISGIQRKVKTNSVISKYFLPLPSSF